MSQKLIDETGHKYGSLTVLSLTKDKNNRTAWLCECDCGNTKIVRGPDLRARKITTCGKGCPYKTERSGVFKDITGMKFGKLTVLQRTGTTNNGKAMWLCQCDCGNTTTVNGTDLRLGATQSCGCLRSKGELYIRQYLISLGIDFLTEYKFKNLYYQESRCPLRFDFAIMNKEKVKGLIEYQGWQHQYPVECFGGKKELEKRKTRDKLKVDYCLENNIPLLIIYPDDNIREKINKFMEDLV